MVGAAVGPIRWLGGWDLITVRAAAARLDAILVGWSFPESTCTRTGHCQGLQDRPHTGQGGSAQWQAAGPCWSGNACLALELGQLGFVVPRPSDRPHRLRAKELAR